MFSERVVNRIRQLPGVQAAAAIRGVPMSEVQFDGRVWLPGEPRTEESARLVRLRVVSRGYFEAMRIPMRAGRDFERQDGVGETGKNKVIIINESLARLFRKGQNPVGQRVVGGEPGNPPEEVIGVVGDVGYTSLDTEPAPEVYLPEGLFPQDEFSIAIRTSSDPGAVVEYIRAAVHEVERDVFYTVYQAEYSRNLIFEIGDKMDQMFQALIDRSRSRLDLKTIKTILGLQAPSKISRSKRKVRRVGSRCRETYV